MDLAVQAQFLKVTKKRRIKVETFVQYEDDEEDLHQSQEVFLDDDGSAQFPLTLYYGNSYSEAQSKENADPTCHYVFKASADNCVNELESELLTMPFVPDCLAQKQEQKAQANQDSAENSESCGSGDCDQCDKKSECFPDDQCEYKGTCKIRDSCKREDDTSPSKEEQRQETTAQTNEDAAQNGAACTQDCATCGKKDECGK